MRVANHSQHMNIELLLQVGGQRLQRGFWHREQVLILRVLLFLPAKCVRHSRFNTIRGAAVPMIVESPNHEVVLRDKRELCGKYRILLFFLQHVQLIQVVVERWLVRNDEVLFLPATAHPRVLESG